MSGSGPSKVAEKVRPDTSGARVPSISKTEVVRVGSLENEDGIPRAELLNPRELAQAGGLIQFMDANQIAKILDEHGFTIESEINFLVETVHNTNERTGTRLRALDALRARVDVAARLSGAFTRITARGQSEENPGVTFEIESTVPTLHSTEEMLRMASGRGDVQGSLPAVQLTDTPVTEQSDGRSRSEVPTSDDQLEPQHGPAAAAPDEGRGPGLQSEAGGYDRPGGGLALDTTSVSPAGAPPRSQSHAPSDAPDGRSADGDDYDGGEYISGDWEDGIGCTPPGEGSSLCGERDPHPLPAEPLDAHISGTGPIQVI